MRFFIIIVFIITVIFGIAAFQNDTEISLKFIKWNFSYHIILTLAVSFGVGLLSGILIIMPALWKKAKAARTHKRRVQELEEEMARGTEEDDETEEDEEGLREESDTPAETREQS